MDTEHRTTSGAASVDRRSPETVFGLLSDESRLRILQALGETPDDPVPFARLHRRSGVDDSGRFNYHLGKLRGTFVRRTDAGYELTYAGRQVIGAMYAGIYTTNATVEALPVGGNCPVCDGDLVAAYEGETARIDCAECGEFRNAFSFPPGSLDQFGRVQRFGSASGRATSGASLRPAGFGYVQGPVSSAEAGLVERPINDALAGDARIRGSLVYTDDQPPSTAGNPFTGRRGHDPAGGALGLRLPRLTADTTSVRPPDTGVERSAGVHNFG